MSKLTTQNWDRQIAGRIYVQYSIDRLEMNKVVYGVVLVDPVWIMLIKNGIKQLLCLAEIYYDRMFIRNIRYAPVQFLLHGVEECLLYQTG